MHLSNGTWASMVASGSSNFDQRIARASQQEHHKTFEGGTAAKARGRAAEDNIAKAMQAAQAFFQAAQKAGYGVQPAQAQTKAILDRQPSTSRSPSRASQRSWCAEDPPWRQQHQHRQWKCGGRHGCGHRGNALEENECNRCGRAWGHWWQAPAPGQIATHNKFQSLAGKGGSSQVEGPAPLASPTSEQALASADDADMETPNLPQDMAKLRKAHSAVASALGADSPEAQSLWAKISRCLEERQAQIPRHILLQRVEKRIQAQEQKLEEAHGELDKIDKEGLEWNCRRKAAQEHGQKVQQDLAELSAEKAGILQQLVEAQTPPPMAPEAIGQSFFQVMGIDLAMAAEVPKCKDLLERMEQIALQLKEAFDCNQNDEKDNKTNPGSYSERSKPGMLPAGPKASGKGTITPIARASGSRSPRRTKPEAGSTAADLGLEGADAEALLGQAQKPEPRQAGT